MNKEDNQYYERSLENWMDQRHELFDLLYELDSFRYWSIVNDIADMLAKKDLEDWIERGRPDE